MARHSGLVDTNGKPLTSMLFAKEKPPRFGRKYGYTEADELRPGVHIPLFAQVAQFDLDSLTVDDFAVMRSHPQVNSSLGVLSFMQHQSPWEIECDDAKVRDFVAEQLHKVWTYLNRAMSQANWAGYSPSVLQWENDVENRAVVVDKILDLPPRECSVKWDTVEGYAPSGQVKPKFRKYGGIKQVGAPDIPVANTLWYPVLMENGNYYGSKLLKSAFTPWYFSILIHLYANRYYERYGEPTPVGRAPFEGGESITPPGQTAPVTPSEYMADALRHLRNRSQILLPSEGVEDGNGKFRFDYDIDFMESQMRGADFERYMNRLDEEITLALFTPVLLMRTADVGSYNLGQGHMQVYLWMMNAMNADRKLYIDKYFIRPLVRYNFGADKHAEIKFRVLGQQNADVIKAVITGLMNSGTAGVDYDELSKIVGMTIKEKEITLAEPTKPDEGAVTKAAESAAGAAKNEASTKNSHGMFDRASKGAPYWDTENILARMIERVTPQVEKMFARRTFTDILDFGYFRQVKNAFSAAGVSNPQRTADIFFTAVAEWAAVMLATQAYESADEFMGALCDYMDGAAGIRVRDGA